MFNTLGLNMIVGPNDSNNLKRCLESFNAKDFFDEIVIVITTDDKKSWEVAKQFTNKVFFQQWTSERHPFGNFAKARNYAIENSTTDYIMWLDCDDIIPEYCLTQLPYLKEAVGINKADFYTLQYKINFVTEKKFNVSTIRERVFKRCKEIKWKYPVHETLTLRDGFIQGKLKGVCIEHRETKHHIESLNRNLLILKHEIDLGKADDMLISLYALELLGTGEKNSRHKAIELLKNVFYKREVGILHLSSIASKLSIELFKNENYIEAELYARASLDMNRKYAEPYVILGDIYSLTGEINKSLLLYKEALNKTLLVGGIQDTNYYKEIPMKRIMLIYIEKKEYELALVFNKKLLSDSPDNEYLLSIKKEIMEKLNA